MIEALRLKWRKTWRDEDEDYVALDRRLESEIVGRIFFHPNGPTMGLWFWSLTAHGKGIDRPPDDRGYCDAARPAAAKVEAAWFRAIGALSDDAPDGCLPLR